ncbi:MAG: hypothetical protein H0V56_09795 [Chthoniobacterales bacterium]|nr:hypothetical protein [Chthoniobacterales bacterium]
MKIRNSLFFAILLVLLCSARVEAQTVTALPPAETAVVGRFARGPIDLPRRVTASEFDALFGSTTPASYPAELQVRQFFANGGAALHVVRISPEGALAQALLGRADELTGLHALTVASDVRLLVAPELSMVGAGEFPALLGSFRAFLEPRRIFLLLDPPPGLASVSAAVAWVQASVPVNASSCAIYFPYLQVATSSGTVQAPASGSMAAVFGRNATWVSPAGTSFPISAAGVSQGLTTAEIDALATNHINPVRLLSGQVVPWSARTLDREDAEKRFIVVPRTVLWVAASVERSLAFAAIADNAEPLWAQIRSGVAGFLHGLYQQGAFAGSTPTASYFVRCDPSTTTPADQQAHRVNVLYGMALLRASEFYINVVTGVTFDPQRVVEVPVLRLRAEGGELFLPFPTLAGFGYQLASRPALGSGTWNAVGVPVNGDGSWQRPVLPQSGGSGFFRVEISSRR